MDREDFRLAHEEQLLAVKNLSEEVKILTESLLDLKEEVIAESTKTRNVRLNQDLKVNTEKEVAVSNLEALQGWLNDVADKLTESIANNAYKPLETLTIKNITEARTETVSINNLGELKSYISEIAKAIGEIQPVVNVAKEDYTMRKPLPVRLSNGKAFYEAVASIGLSLPQNDFGLIADKPTLTINVDTSQSGLVYIGKAVVGTATDEAGWQIKQVDTSSGALTTWADGDSGYNNIWDNRLSLTYS